MQANRPVPPLGAVAGWPATVTPGWEASNNLPPGWPAAIPVAAATAARCEQGPPVSDPDNPGVVRHTVLLRSLDGRICIAIIRTIMTAMQGEVKRGILCERAEDGVSWKVHACGQQHRHWCGSPQVAIKQLSKAHIRARTTVSGCPTTENAPLEMAILQRVSALGASEGIVRLLAVLEDDDNYFIVQEFLDRKELLNAANQRDDLTSRHIPVPEAVVKAWVWQMLRGLRQLHALGLCHRDFSLENALLSSAPAPAWLGGGGLTAKIIDLGACEALPALPGQLLPSTWPNRVGKLAYYAPEMYRQEDYDGRKVDAWTMGVGLFMLLTGSAPYLKQDAAECQHFAEIAAGGIGNMIDRWWRPPHYAISGDAKQVIRALLRPVAAERADLADVEASEWLRPLREAAAAAAAAAAGAGGPAPGGGAAPQAAAAGLGAGHCPVCGVLAHPH